MKIKLKGNKETVIKKGIIYIGEDREGNPILIQAKTRGLLDKRKIEAQAKIFEDFKVPHKEKPVNQLNETEKRLYNLRSEEDKKSRLIITYDETNPQVAEVKTQIETRILASNVVSYFDMDATVEDVDGNEITNWDRWGITSKTLYDLINFIIDEENGLGLGLEELSIINHEITELKKGNKTIGEMKLEELAEQEEIVKELEKAKAVDGNDEQEV